MQGVPVPRSAPMGNPKSSAANRGAAATATAGGGVASAGRRAATKSSSGGGSGTGGSGTGTGASNGSSLGGLRRRRPRIVRVPPGTHVDGKGDIVAGEGSTSVRDAMGACLTVLAACAILVVVGVGLGYGMRQLKAYRRTQREEQRRELAEAQEARDREMREHYGYMARVAEAEAQQRRLDAEDAARARAAAEGGDVDLDEDCALHGDAGCASDLDCAAVPRVPWPASVEDGMESESSWAAHHLVSGYVRRGKPVVITGSPVATHWRGTAINSPAAATSATAVASASNDASGGAGSGGRGDAQAAELAAAGSTAAKERGWHGIDIARAVVAHRTADATIGCQVAARQSQEGGLTPVFMYYDVNAAGDMLPDVVDGGESTLNAARLATLRARDAVGKAQDASGDHDVVYCTESLPELAPKLLDDITPWRWMGAVGAVDEAFHPSLWLGSVNATTQTHWDAQHNMFAQVVGRKRFTLFAPDQADAQYPFPELHPRARKSQVDLRRRPDNAYVSAYPLTRDLACAYSVDLGPGDALYVPPFYWHHVVALEFSVSINVFSESAENDAAHALNAVVFPFEQTWSRAQMSAALHAFVHVMAEGLELHACDAGAALIRSRYSPLADELRDAGAPQMDVAEFGFLRGNCLDPQVLATGTVPLRSGSMERGVAGDSAWAFDASFPALVDERAMAAAAVLRHVKSGIQKTLLHNFMELSVGHFVGRDAVTGFVQGCLCGGTLPDATAAAA